MSIELSEKKTKSSLITTGLALFSMFFGAGNLIFPLLIGNSVGANVWFAILGLGLTAVIIPFLGLAAMLLFQGDIQSFFCRLGRTPGLILLLLLQLILGPFGVIPRLITLMHAMASPYLFDLSLLSFSFFSGVIIFAFSIKRQKLISFLGIILTPLLLASLAALLFSGFKENTTLVITTTKSESFFKGLLGGYNTMDLIAAFLFATVVLPHFKKEIAFEHPDLRRRSLLKKMFFSSLIAASLLFFTYIGLCLISAHHGAFDTSYLPEELLSAIARKLLGPIGGGLAAIAVIIACFTTAITLFSIFAEYLRKDLCKEKISPIGALLITLCTTLLFANLGFSGIAAFLGPILQIIYPGLIFLTILNFFHVLYGIKMVKLPVFFIFICSAIIYFAK